MRSIKNPLVLFLATLILFGCASTAPIVQTTDVALIPVNSEFAEDSLAKATIAPFRAVLDQQMQTIIGRANKRLDKEPVESHLGNFVADAILAQARLQFPGHIDLAVITTGGLRAPIPEGPIRISTIYELMPFENILFIMELTGPQTKAVFDHMTVRKRTAVANSVALIKDDQVHKLFINGAPFDEKGKYTMAISDYLAQGGDGMSFLQEVKILAKIDVKIRDLIIDHIKSLEARNIPVDAEIEGRVKILPSL